MRNLNTIRENILVGLPETPQGYTLETTLLQYQTTSKVTHNFSGTAVTLRGQSHMRNISFEAILMYLCMYLHK